MNGYILNFQLIKTQNCINNTVLLLHDLLLNQEIKKKIFFPTVATLYPKSKIKVHITNYL